MKTYGFLILQCSTSCGNGVQTRHDFCLNRLTHKHVSPIFCRHFPKAIVLRGCSAGPCPEQGVSTRLHATELQAVTPAMHLMTTANAEGARYKGLILPSSALPAVPQERMKETSEGEEKTTKRYRWVLTVCDGSPVTLWAYRDRSAEGNA